MPGLMIGNTTFFFFAEPPALAFGTGDHFFNGLFKILLMDFGMMPTRAKQRGLINRVGEIRSGETRCSLGDTTQIDVPSQRLASDVNLKDRNPSIDVRRVDHDLPIESTRSQQGPIQ